MYSQQLYYDKKPINDLSESLSYYPKKEFCSPFRSTVPLLSLIKDGNILLSEILNETELNTDCDYYLEFKVDPPRGRGAASQTDLMIRGLGNTLAIEAKWTEPRYEIVAEWKDKSRSTRNRERVLRGWLDLIQPHASRVLNTSDFSESVYQMVHRAASACYESMHPHLAYLHFIPDPSDIGAKSEQAAQTRPVFPIIYPAIAREF